LSRLRGIGSPQSTDADAAPCRGGFFIEDDETPLSERQDDAASVCRSCGACCAHSETWPRFTLESAAELDAIAPALVRADGGGMRCIGNRCAALTGEVGVSTGCAIYADRPLVCRDCLPASEECRVARNGIGLPPII